MQILACDSNSLRWSTLF